MHIPDGFLDHKSAAATGLLSMAALGAALRSTRRHLPQRRVPLMGLAAAFVFAAQMLNFPIFGGTSGHLMGGVLVAILLGPGAAIVVLASVLIVQCLVFADGGLLALGANIFNIAVVGGGGGFLVFSMLRKVFRGRRGMLVSTALASWIATVASALCCAGELAASGVAGANMVVPAMAGIHMVIGLGEAIITTLIVAWLHQARPELFDSSLPAGAGRGRMVEMAAIGLLVSIGLAIFVAPFATPLPDGLERVAALLGFDRVAAPAIVNSPLADYQVAGLGSTTMAVAIAGAIGTIAAMVVGLVLARILTPSQQNPKSI